MKVSFSRLLVFVVAVILFNPDTHAQVVEIPDQNLRKVIRETLELTAEQPITQQEMLQLIKLDAGGNRGITNLTGIEHATNLRTLELYKNPITDIAPLAHLTNLRGFNLWGCRINNISPLAELTNLRLIVLGRNQISDLSPLARLTNLTFLELESNQITDITPLAGLTNLTTLQVDYNQISDFSPIANLVNLEVLWINDNWGTDISSLTHLNLIDFRYDQVCNLAPVLPPVTERIENRTYPSAFAAWGGVGWSPIVNRPDLSDVEQITLHDLHWTPYFRLHWQITLEEPAYGVSTQIAGDLDRARELRQQRLNQNPNMIFLITIDIHNHFNIEDFPPDSDFWLRDAQGQVAQNREDQYLINFLKPEVQQLIIDRTLAIDRCGVYDGIVFDGFYRNGSRFVGRRHYPFTDDEIIKALLNIFRGIRAQVREDFLIIVNANDTKPTLYTEFVNGTFMETSKTHPDGYSYEELKELEDILLWAEESLRYPQVNCLEGEGMSIEPPDGPNNLRWMRLFTTLSLTHSDGYVLYTDGLRDLDGPAHDHLWHPFWDANLGRPVGPKAQQYQDIEGLFIREFTNGWALYNRSGESQTIALPKPVIAVGNGDLRSKTSYLLPDLDGEIYLTSKSFADVNSDGVVNILDLLQVANNFGKSTPDPNSDGVVNILDLVFVTQQFSQ